jgi:hypothetical protein
VEHLAGLIVVNDGSDRNLDFQILTVAPVTSTAFAVASSFSAKRVVITKFEKGVFVNIGGEIDIAAVAAIAAAGAAPRNKLFPAEGDAAVAAIACFDRDFGFVDEQCYSTGWMEMNRPVAPLFSN